MQGDYQAWKEKCHHRDEWITLTGKLEMCKASLTKWSKGKNGNTKKEIANKCKLLEELQEKEGLTNRTQMQQLQREVNLLLKQEDLHWQQRSRELWLKEEDKNTKFFHACVKHKRPNGFIHDVTDLNGVVWLDMEDLENAFVDYYKNLFTSDKPRDMSSCLQDLAGRVSMEMNDGLLTEFSREEVVAALHQMSALKDQDQME
jgi:hypothetical protein